MFRRNECDEIAQMLWDYADLALDSLEYDRVAAHLAKCESCRCEAEAYRLTTAVVATERNKVIPESDATWMQLRATLELENRAIAAPKPLIRRIGPAWAVAFAGALAGVVFLKMSQREPTVPFQDSSIPMRMGR